MFHSCGGTGCLVPDITDHRRAATSSEATPALLLLEFRVKAQEHFPKQTATLETFTVRFPCSNGAWCNIVIFQCHLKVVICVQTVVFTQGFGVLEPLHAEIIGNKLDDTS